MSTQSHALNPRHLATNVALSATGIVAGVYMVISIIIALFVSSSLTSQFDTRLKTALTDLSEGVPPYIGQFSNQSNSFGTPSPSNHFETPLIIWIISPNGIIESNYPNAVLPSSGLNVTSPTTITVSKTEFRVAGQTIGDSHIVVGLSTEPITSTQASLLTGELIALPLLLAFIFIGSYTVGLRVARPIEAARQRQLEFTANASHELRTPLSVIEAQASIALSQKRKPDAYIDAFGHVRNETSRMRHLLEELLWLARFDGSESPPPFESVDCVAASEMAVERFTPLAEQHGLTLHGSSFSPHALIEAPPEWIERLLGVLIDNAIKYTPSGGSITVEAGMQLGRTVIAVHDTGPGIPKEELPHIFDRFHRVSNSPEGAGLGLSIADAIVQATNGKWEVTPAPKSGLRMSVSWQGI
ncbi:MAG: sensor histidine kinase [Candidatus Dormibacteria bacterium]